MPASPDPVTDAIALLRPRPVVDPRLHATGEWALRFDRFPHVRLGVVARGRCWLTLEGHEPVPLEEGDFYLLGNAPHHTLASAPGVAPRHTASLWDRATDGVVRIGSEAGEDTYVCGGRFAFEGIDHPILTEVLPQFVRVRATDPRGALLKHLCELLLAEVEVTAVGGSLILEHLAQVLFVHMLRAHAEQADRPTGWLGALADDSIGAALRAMHRNVAHPWTLNELADISRMSRSSFASAFKNRIGTAPLEYLIQWRMSLARDALSRGDRPISELAFATGYKSESAFSTAFRRVTGRSPRQFREEAKRSVATHHSRSGPGPVRSPPDIAGPPGRATHSPGRRPPSTGTSRPAR